MPHFRQAFVHAVHAVLKPHNIFCMKVGECHFYGLFRCLGELGTNGKKTVLDFAQPCRHFLVAGRVADDADIGVELVDRSIAFNAQVVFGDAYAANQCGSSFIAGLRVDLEHLGYSWTVVGLLCYRVGAGKWSVGTIQ